MEAAAGGDGIDRRSRSPNMLCGDGIVPCSGARWQLVLAVGACIFTVVFVGMLSAPEAVDECAGTELLYCLSPIACRSFRTCLACSMNEFCAVDMRWGTIEQLGCGTLVHCLMRVMDSDNSSVTIHRPRAGAATYRAIAGNFAVAALFIERRVRSIPSLTSGGFQKGAVEVVDRFDRRRRSRNTLRDEGKCQYLLR